MLLPVFLIWPECCIYSDVFTYRFPCMILPVASSKKVSLVIVTHFDGAGSYLFASLQEFLLLLYYCKINWTACFHVQVSTLSMNDIIV